MRIGDEQAVHTKGDTNNKHMGKYLAMLVIREITINAKITIPFY